MKGLVIFCMLYASAATAQHSIAHFSIWKPKTDPSDNFVSGYKRHLQWHKSNNDSWNWYGWFIISGPRTGQFLDATVGHAWADFDSPVNPAGDAADNAAHTMPFGDFMGSTKMELLPWSLSVPQILKSKLMRMYTVNVSNILTGARDLEKIIIARRQKGWDKYAVLRVVDGGDVQQLVVLLGADSYADLARFSAFPEDLMTASAGTVAGLSAETLLYNPDMSLNIP